MDAEKLFEATKKGDFKQVHQILKTLNDTTKERTIIGNTVKSDLPKKFDEGSRLLR